MYLAISHGDLCLWNLHLFYITQRPSTVAQLPKFIESTSAANMGSGDGIFRFRDGIAIAQIILFSLSFLCAIQFRRERRIGWFCIGVFSILRVVGAGCMVGTVKRDSDSLWAGVFVCESLGVLLLIFTLLEMLERMYVFPKRPGKIRNEEEF